MDYRQKLNELGITLEKSGKQICPQCSATRKNKRDKCLSVTYKHDAVVYYCHHCEWTGSVFYEDKTKQYNRPVAYKTKDDNSPLIRYFAKRGISEETLNKYKIGYNDKKQIIFPYYKNGELVNVKTRENLGNGKKTFTQTKDAEKTFFGIDFVKNEKSLIIVEGEIDVLSLAEQQINAVSVPQGGSDKKLECLSNCSNEFIQQFESFVIATDNDEVGKKLRDNLIERIPRDKCKTVNWGRYKDANEALVAGEDLHTYINEAKWLNTDGVYSFTDPQKWDILYNELFSEDTKYYKTGWRDFDDIVKIRTGYLMVVSGYPSRGKSYFVKNMLVNLAKKYDMKHLFASFEDTVGSLYSTLYQIYTQKTINATKHEYGEQALEEILCSESSDFISEHFKVFENNRMWDIDSIIERTEIECIKNGIKTLVIDPYNRLKNDYHDREDKYIGDILAKLCTLAKRLNILVIFVAHPRKPEKGEANMPPNLYDISGSGDWYNMTDYGIIIHRQRSENGKLEDKVQINVQKIKNFALGDPKGGIIELGFNKAKMNIENL